MKITEQLQIAADLATLWGVTLPGIPPPPTGMLASWVGMYQRDAEQSITYALSRTAAKARKMEAEGQPMQTDDCVRYASSVLRNEHSRPASQQSTAA